MAAGRSALSETVTWTCRLASLMMVRRHTASSSSSFRDEAARTLEQGDEQIEGVPADGMGRPSTRRLRSANVQLDGAWK